MSRFGIRLGLMPLGAVRTYLILGGVDALIAGMVFTVLAVYYVQTVGMNPLQLVLIGTVLEVTVLLFEIPTGVVADVYSRRLSILIGFVPLGLCYLVQGSFPLFALIVVAEFVRGIGETFLSGAVTAWIADEVGEARFGQIYLRYSQIGHAARLVGIGVGTALATVSLTLPILLGGALWLLLALFLVLVMPETGFTPAPRTPGAPPWQTLRTTAFSGYRVLRGHAILWMLVGVTVVFGAFSEGFDRLWEAHFLTSFVFPAWPAWPPVVWIGLLNGGGMLIGLGVTEVLIRRWEIHGSRRLGRLLWFNSAALIVAIIGFGLAPTFGLGVAAFWLASVLRDLQGPIATTWLNQHLPSQVRATVLSMVGQADALGQVAGGPVVGVVGLRSLRAALVFAGIILSPALLLYGRGMRLEEEAADAEPPPTT